MATYTHNINFTVPVLPYPTPVYEQEYFNQHNEILRIYFNQLDETLRDGTATETSETLTWFMS
tara:strand:+ start:5368 stop:5556 length:189 start_codon:yes stop_codon:yes gene_type:complete